MTTAKRATVKELALSAIKSLPDDADIDDIIEEIIVFHTLQERLERTDQEPAYTHDEVKRWMTLRASDASSSKSLLSRRTTSQPA